MGQKVNPVIFRLGNMSSEASLLFSRTSSYAGLLRQDQEIKNFLSTLLQSRGIILRSCKILRSSQGLLVVLDFYFSYVLAKQSKFYWARSLFKTIKRKYIKINRIKNLKELNLTLQDSEDFNFTFSSKQKKKFLVGIKKRNKFLFVKKNKQQLLKSNVLVYKNRFYFFLFLKKNKNLLVNKKEISAQLSIMKNYKRSFKRQVGMLRLSFAKFKKLFSLKKFRYNFRDFYLKKSISLYFRKQDNQNFLDLNKKICTSLYNYTGVENIEIKIVSSQLNFLPAFKLYKKNICKELRSFQKNRDIRKYFFEVQENLFFVLGTFGYGNARLVGRLLVVLFENIRKQLFIVKFLKKTLEVFFTKFSPAFLAVHGIRILVKGRFNKRRRTKKIVLQQGQVSLQTISVPIDYCQTKAVTIYGTFGIKVWLSKR